MSSNTQSRRWYLVKIVSDAVLGSLGLLLLLGGTLFGALLPALFFIAIVWFAASCVFGPKQNVLVLRRFRDADSIAILSGVLRRRLKKRYRFVTLDDATFPKIGVPIFVQSIWLSASPISILLAFVSLVLILMIFPVMPLLNGSGMIGMILVLGFLMLVLPLLIPQLIVALLIGLLVLLYAFYVKRSSRVSITDGASLDRVARRVRRLQFKIRSSFLSGPQSILVTVASDFWKDAVLTLSKDAGAIVIDISDLSENLEWELSHAAIPLASCCLLIGDKSRVGASTLSLIGSMNLGSRTILYEDNLAGRRKLGERMTDFLDVIPYQAGRHEVN